MAKKVEDTIAATSGFPGDGGLGTPNQDAGETPEPAPPDTGEVENSAVSFPLPEGFKPPAGIKNGEEFTALASLKMGEDGNLQLSKIDGIPVNGEAEEEGESKEEEAGEQNPPGVTGASGAIPSGGSAIASARNVMGDMGMPA